ncbi:MAG: hypothetical protein AAF915_11415 [Cyanobacteria bacterium P01_D01_bin.50]
MPNISGRWEFDISVDFRQKIDETQVLLMIAIRLELNVKGIQSEFFSSKKIPMDAREFKSLKAL